MREVVGQYETYQKWICHSLCLVGHSGRFRLAGGIGLVGVTGRKMER
jgi:S-adenosylmethionine synthetase